jgi:hypothetical protein
MASILKDYSQHELANDGISSRRSRSGFLGAETFSGWQMHRLRKARGRPRQPAAAAQRNRFALNSFFIMAERPFAKFDLEKAIALRWALRDIVAKRLKLTPVSEDELRTLTELGYVEIRDGTPVVTQAGLEALD